MDIVIKPMESDSEIRGKAYVHWKKLLCVKRYREAVAEQKFRRTLN